jgi:hypothetical protein
MTCVMGQTISTKHVNRIAAKLDKLSGLLSAEERLLLMAVFRLADEEVERRLPPMMRSLRQRSDTESGQGGVLPQTSRVALSTAFTDAFKPLHDRELRMREQVGRSETGARIVIEW